MRNTAAAAAAAAAAATTTPTATTPGVIQPVLGHCCDPLIRGNDAGRVRGEEWRCSVWISLLTAGEHGGGCSMESDGLRAEGEFLVLYGLCRERLENRVLETALVSCCSAHENHEGGEYNIMILAAVQADLLSTTQHRQNSGRLLFGIVCHMLVQRGGRIFSVLGVCSFLAARLCYCYLIFYYGWAKPMLIVLLSKIMGGGIVMTRSSPQHQHQRVWRLFHSPAAISTQAELFVFYLYTR